MSDNIPIEIQLEIMTRLPVKSLVQFRSVSKTWKSHIDTSDFIINHYTSQHAHAQRLLVQYKYRRSPHVQPQAQHLQYPDSIVRYHANEAECEEQYVSVADDHSFPQRKVSLALHPLVKMLQRTDVIGCSHGLLALYSRNRNDFDNPVVVIWNPSVRKAVAVMLNDVCYTALGFGVCRETNDPKIVKIRYVNVKQREMNNKEYVITRNPPRVDVFTLSTGVWRRSYGNLLRESITFLGGTSTTEFIDGVCYWLATDSFFMDRDFKVMVISFDMTSEELTEIHVPDNFHLASMSKLGESLVVAGHDDFACDACYNVWMMGDGVPKSFTKLFSLATTRDFKIRGFRTSGEIIIDVPERGEDDRGQLAICMPYSTRVNNLGVEGLHRSFVVSDYTESLLLLDQEDLMVYDA